MSAAQAIKDVHWKRSAFRRDLQSTVGRIELFFDAVIHASSSVRIHPRESDG